MNNSDVWIPVTDLPEGILLALKNADRYFNDSKLLFVKKKYASANILMYLAIEEFSKANLILEHYKNKKPIIRSDYKKFFRDHELRLEEFDKFFEKYISEIPAWAKGSKGIGKRQRILKERMMYVDWLQDKWHDPLYFTGLILSDEKDIEDRMKGIFIVHKNQFIYSWNKLINKPIIQKIKKSLTKDALIRISKN